MPSSINMPSTENEKRSMKEHIDKYLAVSPLLHEACKPCTLQGIIYVHSGHTQYQH